MPPKPKLTPEERKALKLQKKLEKKKLAELKKKQLKHDELQRELNYGQLTHRHHEKEWRRMLIDIAHPRILEDLKYAWHNFERVVDSKDFTISLMMDEVRDAEEQYLRNLRAHCSNIDRLLIMFRDRIVQLRKDYEDHLEELQIRVDSETEVQNKGSSEMEEYIKTMVFGLKLRRKEQQNIVRGEYLSRVDDEESKYGNVLQNMRSNLDNIHVGFWNNTMTFLKDYDEKTSQRKQDYEVLKNQDDDMNILLVTQLQKIQSSVELIKTLKNKYNELSKTRGKKIGDLRKERQYFADAFWTLKIKLANDRLLDGETLQSLTHESNKAIDQLVAIEKKGEQLLKLSAICRKFETIDEKLMPFPCITSLEMKALNDTEQTDGEKIADLELFWRRVAQADAARYAINEEREFLKRENTVLKKRIHQYCMCVECPSSETGSVKECKKVNNVIDGYMVQKNYKTQFNNDIMEVPDEYE